MAYKKFKFDPEEGFSDSSFYEDTPENPREILQRQHNQTRDYINSVIDTLNSKNEGSSGSESIMSPEIEGVNGDNVFEQIRDIKRQINEVERHEKLEKKRIPEDIDYTAVRGLRIEAAQKLQKLRPLTIGQASRISGVNPADVSVLLIYLGMR